MHKHCTAMGKRILAFTLAFVLVLSLVPVLSLTANAAYTNDGWQYFGSYTWLEGRFHSDDADLVFVDDQPYDWKATIYQSRTTATVTVDATVKDASGTTVASITGKSVTATKSQDSVMLSYEDLTALTTDLYGTFTLTCNVKVGSSTAATLTKTFSRTASNPIVSTVTSRSNPDNAFTFADPIDLVLNIKKLDGAAAAYNAAVTVTTSRDAELLAARGLSLPASTNITLSVKDLVDLPAIEVAGTYKVNLTLTDSNGTLVHQAAFPFSVMALTNNLTASITSASGSSLTFNSTVPDLVVNLKKTDGIAEGLITAVTVKDSSGDVVYTGTFETTDATATVTPDLSGLAVTGTFTMTAEVTDDAGNYRATVSPVTFIRTNTTPMSCTLSDYSPEVYGNIYSTDSDFNLSLAVTHYASRGQSVTAKVIGTLNGSAFEASKKATLTTSMGKTTIKIDGAMLGGYGFFENLYIAVYDASGVEQWRSASTYTFTRVLSTATPGSLPLVNLNDHFTSGTGDPTTKLTLAADTGANMWRACIPWASVEQNMGVFTMPAAVKDVMNSTKTQGMQALVVLGYNNDLYGEANPNDSTWLNAYKNYCYQIAKYFYQNYPNQVVYYEVWNEWNANMGKIPEAYRDGASYAKVVIAASQGVKSANPNAKIVAGALAGDASSHGDWIRDMLKTSGAIAAMDAFSFHTYPIKQLGWFGSNYGFASPAEHGYAAALNSINALLTECGAGDKEVWLTETGWSTNTKGAVNGKNYTGTSEALQAAYMTQLYAWALAHPTSIDRIFWYDFMNDGVDATQIEENWGLIRNHSDDAAYTAKPSYVAMCAFTSKMNGATYNATITTLGSDVFAYQFKTDSGYLMVAWTSGSTKNLTATLNGSMVVTDMYGNATTYSGTAPLTLSETPVYLEYNAASHPTIG